MLVNNNPLEQQIEKLAQLYEGKAKQLFATNDPELVIVHYKNSLTAGNGEKRAELENKGFLNNQITSIIYPLLEQKGIKTHFIKKINDTDQLCKKVTIFPLEVIVRNYIAGSMAKRVGIPEGTKAKNLILEICYKNDDFGDPLINDHHAVAMDLASYTELEIIYQYATQINQILIELFAKLNINLIDFKLEFGKTSDGTIVLADEISPDTCRLWDKTTNEKLDKDRFRRDLGKVEDAYQEILKRLAS